jgi:hypothetical protein
MKTKFYRYYLYEDLGNGNVKLLRKSHSKHMIRRLKETYKKVYPNKDIKTMVRLE